MHPDLRRAFDAELDAASAFEQMAEWKSAFRHLERAHILSQQHLLAHASVHVRMALWGARSGDWYEFLMQWPRVLAALTVALLWVPIGNTGGARVSAFRPMPVPPELKAVLDLDEAD